MAVVAAGAAALLPCPAPLPCCPALLPPLLRMLPGRSAAKDTTGDREGVLLLSLCFAIAATRHFQIRM